MRQTGCWAAALLVQVGLLLAAMALEAADQPTAGAQTPPAAPADSHEPKAADQAAAPDAVSIEDALKQKVSLDFKETSLIDVLGYLSDKAHVQIVLDPRALTDASIAADQSISVRVKNVTLKSALDLALSQVKNDPTYVIRDEVLLITSHARAAKWMVTRVYPLDHLAKTDVDFPTLLKAHVAPLSWDTAGGYGSVNVVAGMLIVTQTEENQTEVERLWSGLTLVHDASTGTKPAPAR
ncbi:MAG TPA: hypothetical protein VFE24_12265 [Pirellulales bacterium]|jgi:hypothetical protein|nr:hypothetical protein [Pirellulales bacterium]